MGASLGALAMLHAHRAIPASFGGLFLQSGSFFRQRFDRHERGFPRFDRIARFVGARAARRTRGTDPVPVAMTCGTGEENLRNNRARRDGARRQGYDVDLARAPRRAQLGRLARRARPAPRSTLLAVGMGVTRRATSIPAPSIGGAGRVLAYGHYGRPLLVFPSEQGRRWQYEERGMIAASPACIDAGRRQALLRRQLRLVELARRRARRSRSARARHGALRGLDPRPGRARGSTTTAAAAREIVVTGCSFGAYHAANFALKRADLFPLAICQSGVYDVVGRRLGRARRRRLLQQPDGLRRAPARRPPRLAARPGQPAARVRAGAMGGHDGRAREHEALRRAAGRRRGSATSSTSGATTSRTTGPRGARSSPTTSAEVLLTWRAST